MIYILSKKLSLRKSVTQPSVPLSDTSNHAGGVVTKRYSFFRTKRRTKLNASRKRRRPLSVDSGLKEKHFKVMIGHVITSTKTQHKLHI